MNRQVSCLLILVSLIAVGALGQSPPQGMMPGSGPQAPLAQPEPAEPDTVIARLVLPENWAEPVRIGFAPDTMTVGSDALLELEFAPGVPTIDPLQLMDEAEFSSAWIDWKQDLKGGLEPGRILHLPVTVYQINPFRVQVGNHKTQVVLVDFRTSGLQETAAIRDPRRWGWNLLTLVIAAILLTALLLLAWWAWTARKVATEKLPQWDVPPPAWLSSIIELKELHEQGLVDRGEGRQYLDQLAGICRRFVSGRFRVGAVEMTGSEIAQTCVSRGHSPEAVERLSGLISEIDSSRYDPEPPSPNSCRQRGRTFMAAMAKVRVIPKYTPVEASLDLAAASAWTQLKEQLLESEIHSDEESYAPGSPGEGA